MANRDSSGRAWTGQSPETIDRILVGLCALIWLVLLGLSVAAGVALVDLGRGFHKPAHNAHTGLLYIVIGVSALIILAAIPVLLRARRVAGTRPIDRATGPPIGSGGMPTPQPGRQSHDAGTDHRTTESRSPASLIGTGDPGVDRLLLRGLTELVSVIGTALIAVAAATYLMAVGKDAAAWASYGIAGLVTVAMPAVPWRYMRLLRTKFGASPPPV